MSKRVLVTIGRQFGSGGREIGKRLAELLGVAFYDKELLTMAAKESGLTPELFEDNDEMPVNSLLYSLSMHPYSGVNLSVPDTMPISQKLFLAQFDAVRKLAQQQDCIIVGRCADYALREEPDCVNVFIHAPLAWRISQVQARSGLSAAKAKELIQKTDKRRAAYYNAYSDKRWGAVEAYHLAVDSAALGVEKTAILLETFVKNR